jgi:uracil-DNA glycosylase family 4
MMNPVQEKMMAEMGIGPRWKLRADSPGNQISSEVATPTLLPSASNHPTELSTLMPMKNALATESSKSICQVCGSYSITSKAVASGQSRIENYLFIRECTNDREIDIVSPMTGAADALLNGILRELRIKRGISAHLVNIVKTKTKPNASAGVGRRVYGQDGEILACVSCLKKQIELIDPSVIISLGNIAAMSLLDLADNTNDLRGSLYRYEGVPLIVTYELDYLLQNPKEKHSLWSDLCLAMKTVKIH